MVSKAESSIVIFFLVCLLKIENIKAQCEKPLLQGNRQLTAGSHKQSYPDGSTAEFECSIGYVPVNSRVSKSITCNGNTWTDLELQCKKRSCGALADIPNGIYKYSPEGDEGILYGGTATAECNKGHVLLGKQRICTEKGWNGRDPVCEVVKCSPPPDVVNGKPTEPLEEFYEYQAVVTYSCNGDYVLSGSASISCMENGEFETPPQCIKLPCGVLDVPNSVTTGARPPYKLGSFVSFQCIKGYSLEGASDLTCGISGWSSPPPQCNVHQATTTRQPSKATTPRNPRPATEEREILPHPTNPPSKNIGVKVALGIGIPVVVLALAVGVYLFKKRSSTRGYSGNVAKNEDGQL